MLKTSTILCAIHFSRVMIVYNNMEFIEMTLGGKVDFILGIICGLVSVLGMIAILVNKERER